MVLSSNKKSQPLEATNIKITAQQAIDYISSHPQILLDHPHLLAEIMLPFTSSPASLVERQVKKLREINKELENQVITSLEAERLKRDEHDKGLKFITAIIGSKSFEIFMLRLEHQCLKAKLKNFRLCLYPNAATKLIDENKQYRPNFRILSEEITDICKNKIIVKENIVLGPQREAFMRGIFGDYTPRMSSALIPLRGRCDYGFLAFAEANSKNYVPKADTTLFQTLQMVLPTILDSFVKV